MEFPKYFLEFIKRSQRTDKFPSDSNYDRLLSIIKLQKGEQMEGVTADKKKHVRRTYKIDTENGTEYLVCLRSGKRILKHSQFFNEMILYHDNSGHSGRDNTYKKLRAVYENVPVVLISSYIEACGPCNDRRLNAKPSSAIQSINPSSSMDRFINTERLGRPKVHPVSREEQGHRHHSKLKTLSAVKESTLTAFSIPGILQSEIDNSLVETTEDIKDIHCSENSLTVCDNCNKAAENKNVSAITIEDDFSIVDTDVRVWDAIVYIYGVSPKEFQNFSKQYSKTSPSVRLDSTVNLCDSCMPLLSENYKIHKKFNESSNSVSIIQQFAEFCKRKLTFIEPKPKSDIACNSPNDFRPEHGDDDHNLFDDFNFGDDGNEAVSFTEEDFNEQKHEPTMDTVVTKTKNVNVCKEGRVTRGSLKAKAYVKLRKLSEEDYQNVKEIPGISLNSEAKSDKSDSDYQPEENDFKPKRVRRQKSFVKQKSSFPKNRRKNNRRKKDKSHSDNMNAEMDFHSSEGHENPGEKSKKSVESSDSKTVYQCDKCEKTFTNQNTFKSHRRVHNGKPPYYNCKICGRSYHKTSYSRIRDHILSHSREKCFECPTCNERFQRRSQLETHKRIHIKEFNFSCEQCGKSFKLLHQLRSHQKTHTNEEHVCADCNRCFKCKEYLKIHRKRVHSGQKFVCEECGSTFTQSYSLTLHIKRLHKNELIYECEICGKHLSSDVRLKTHMWTHTGEKPLVCKVEGCNAKFSNQDGFDAHVRSHNGIKFECTVCGKKFDRKQYLKWHFRVHTGETPRKRIPKLKTGSKTILGQPQNSNVTLPNVNVATVHNIPANGTFIGHNNIETRKFNY